MNWRLGISLILVVVAAPTVSYIVSGNSTICLSIATIIAVLIGPVFAVIVTRFIDEERAHRSRKLEIFRALMKTRNMKVHIEHVWSLNLVEIEFIDDDQVIMAWKEYLRRLGEKLPHFEDRNEFENAVKRRDAHLSRLLSEIAKVLKMKVEQLDIFEGNYLPQGWVDDDLEQRLARRSLVNVLTAKSPILVRPDTAVPVNSPYPPAPNTEQY